MSEQLDEKGYPIEVAPDRIVEPNRPAFNFDRVGSLLKIIEMAAAHGPTFGAIVAEANDELRKANGELAKVQAERKAVMLKKAAEAQAVEQKKADDLAAADAKKAELVAQPAKVHAPIPPVTTPIDPLDPASPNYSGPPSGAYEPDPGVGRYAEPEPLPNIDRTL